MPVFSVLAFACVSYVDGAVQCDIRTQYEVAVPTVLECQLEVDNFVMSLASSAFTSGDVAFILEQSGTCYQTNEQLDDALFDLTNRFGAEGKHFTTTHY